MVKRVSYRSYFYVAFALILLLLSWESNKTNAALLASQIPQEAIRLRILANSDSVQDQALKRLVRDVVVEEMNQWVSGPATIQEARTVVAAHLPAIRQLVTDLLIDRGFTYEVDVELGQVDFPTKMYGSQVYPAGEYEALKISIGNAQGQNWWCVLFPPLCFVDLAMGEAVAEPDEIEQSGDRNQTDTNINQSAGEQNLTKADLPIESEKQVRFFLFDAAKNLFAAIKGWFA